MTKIVVEPPSGDARRDRIEREVFARLAAMRAADRADAAVHERKWPRYTLAFGGIAAAAAIAVVLLRGGGDHVSGAVAPSLVVTPVGGSSRFTVGDAVIDAGSDTSVEVKAADDGAVTLVLARGSVDCDVAPRAGREPFRVVADDVTVEVVGTRFTVARRPEVRVDVARGKVQVTGPAGIVMVAAGESWTKAAAALAEPKTETPTPTPTLTPTPTRTDKPRVSREAEYHAAQKLARTDPVGGARAYEAIAKGSDSWAGLALYDLADMRAASDPDAALRDFAAYLQRFPHGAMIEDAAWTRIEILRRLHRTDDVRREAAAFVQRFPASPYADDAARFAKP